MRRWERKTHRSPGKRDDLNPGPTKSDNVQNDISMCLFDFRRSAWNNLRSSNDHYDLQETYRQWDNFILSCSDSLLICIMHYSIDAKIRKTGFMARVINLLVNWILDPQPEICITDLSILCRYFRFLADLWYLTALIISEITPISVTHLQW
jgi:hypothetical protein